MGNLLRAIGLQTMSEAPPDGPVGDYSVDVTPAARDHQAVTLERAVALPAAYRALQITGTMGAQLAIEAVRGGRLVDQPLVRQPDPWRSLESWVERVLVGMAADGNAFLLKHRHPDGSVASIEAANPRNTAVRWAKVRGRWVKTYDVWTRDGNRTWQASDVEHIWLLEVPGHDRGLGPIAACRMAWEGILDVRDYADNWFHDTDQPSGVLKSDQRLDPDQAAHYKKTWRNPDADLPAEERRRGPQVRVLGQGLSYDPMTLNPEDAQWLQAQNMGVLDVARMFGQPAQYLLAALEGSNLTYTTWAAIDQTYLRTTLYPVYLRKVQAALTNCLPRGQVARFDLSRIERPDAETRARIDQMYLPMGIGTPAEVAARENRAVGTPTAAPVTQDQEVPA